MTASPVKAVIVPWFRAAVVATVLAWPLMAVAQDAYEDDDEDAAPAPMRLVPRSDIQAPVPETPQPVRSFFPSGLGSAVQVDVLDGVDPDSAGVLGLDEGGFPPDMWAGTSRDLMRHVLSRLPSAATSPAMRHLMRRLLLSVSTAPEGDGVPGELAALRVGVLADMGELAGVEALLGAVPARRGHDKLERMEAEVRLLTGDHARACALAGGRMIDGAQIGDVFWNKLFIFCQALAGQSDAAALGVSLLRELDTEDQAFFALVDGLTSGQPVTIASLAAPTPLHLAMARIAQAKLPGDVIASNRPGVLHAIATSPNIAIAVRLEAAERAESSGALAGVALRQLYMSVPFKASELASAVSIADKQRGPRSRALLYRAALAQTVPTARAEAVALALKLGREGGRFGSTAAAFSNILRDIPPTGELDWFAADAIRALLVAGEPDLSAQWLDLLRGRSAFDPTAAITLHTLMPLLRLAGADAAESWSIEELEMWWNAVKGEDTASERAAILFSLFEAAGETVPEHLWEPLMRVEQRVPVVLPHPALWHRLGTAAEAERLAETVALALIAMGEEGPAQSSALMLSHVLGALNRIGLTKHARAMAVEAAMAAGL